LKNVNLLSHSLQQSRGFSTSARSNNHNRTGYRSYSSNASHRMDEEPYSAAREAGFDAFEACLTCGGDDRSLILDSGTNKYHIRPQPVDPAHVFRGSCTGNPPTQRGYDAAKALFDRLPGLDEESLDSSLGEVYDDQRSRLSKLLDLPEGAEVILCPSGSDAEYIPLAIARALKGDVHISNGVVQVR